MFATGLGLVAGLAGCAVTSHPPAAIDRATIDGHTERFFQRAVLLKPRASWAATNLAFMLAPLLLQEVSDANPTTADTPHEIFYAESKLPVNGIMHKQITFFWFTPADASAKQQIPMRAQGVRITLNARAEPVLWEILPDHSNTRIVFISQGLEFQTTKMFGPPLPGRRFAVEQSLANAPTIVVARVIDDGPATMGPIVHTRAGTGDVTTLICRCMPTQTREIVTTENYELRPLAASPLAAKVLRRRWPPSATRIEDYLRLPPDF